MIDALIILMYLSLAAALVVTAWAVWRSVRIVGKTSGRTHGIAVRRINATVAVSVIIILALSFALAPTAPIHLAAATYADTLWLRAANMFVATASIALAAATVSAVYSLLRTGDFKGAARSLLPRRHLSRRKRIKH